jgi:DNA repair exonuclease SbcCD ATPase subunit
MRLKRIQIRHAPGIDTPFTVDEIAAGINVLVGPNGSGKTTLRRTIQQMLWPDAKRDASASVEAFFEDDGQQLRAERQSRTVQWQRDGSPSEAPWVPGAHLARCYSIGMGDLLTDGADTDTKITNEIRKEMSGGYDLAVLRQRFAPSRSRAAYRECTNAADDVRTVELTFHDLAEEETKLVELGKKREQADAAHSRVPLLTSACEAANARRELAELKAARGALPASLEQYSGDEDKQLAEKDGELEENAKESQGLEARVADARNEAAETRLEEEPDAGQLKAWEERAAQLGRLEDARDARLEKCEKLRLEAAAALPTPEASGGTDAPPEISVEDLDEIEAGLGRIQDARAQVAAIQAELDALRVPAEDPDAQSGASENARLLRNWLAASEGRPSGQLSLVALTGALLALVAGILAAMRGPAWLGIAGPALGLALLAPLLFHAFRRSSGERARIQGQLGADGCRVPARWTSDEIQTLLRELDARAAKEHLAGERRSQAKKEEARLQTATAERDEQEAQATARARRAGIKAKGQLGLVTIAAGVRARLDAESAHKTAAGQLAAATADLEKELAGANLWLAEQGYPKATDASDVRGFIGDLRDRRDALRSARKTLASLQEDIALAEDRRKNIRKKIAAIYASVELADGAQDSLRRTLDLHPRWKDLSEKIRDQEGHLARTETALADHPALLDLSIDDAAAALESARSEADAMPDLVGQIVAIETRVDQAGKGKQLEEKLASAAAARTSLEEFREMLLHSEAASFLLEQVSAEHGQTSQPPVLKRAMEYFGAFTRNGYELVPPEGTEPTFRALEVETQRGFALSELSSGTRIQLLLAVRLAFAIHEAGDRKLPLFLDEALSTADPDRFAAVADSLKIVASDGFQVFYLTSNPTDAAHWQAIGKTSNATPPKILDLAAIRGKGERLPGLATLAVPEPKKLPAPDGLTPEEYGRAIGVGAVHFDKPVESLHLYYLLGSDTETLHTILRVTHLASLGRWESFARSTRAAGILPVAVSDLVDARARCARAVFAARSIGRGKPIDRPVLEQSEAVSSTYLDRFVSLAEELKGDAKRFVAALREGGDERTKRYQADKREMLIAFLEDQEYLDTSEPLEVDGIRAQTLAALYDDLGRGTLDTDTCHALVDRLLNAGTAHAATTTS